MDTLHTISIESDEVVRDGFKDRLTRQSRSVVETCDKADSIKMSSIATSADRHTILLRVNDGSNRDQQIRAIKAAKANNSNAQIIVLGSNWDLAETLEALRAGANACLDDGASIDVFLKTIELASLGFAAVSTSGLGTTNASMARAIDHITAKPNSAATLAPARLVSSENSISAEPDAQAQPAFSPRESSVLQLLQEGAPNKAIARRLSLTEATVKVHLKSILRKIRVKNRTQAAVWASNTAWSA